MKIIFPIFALACGSLYPAPIPASTAAKLPKPGGAWICWGQEGNQCIGSTTLTGVKTVRCIMVKPTYNAKGQFISAQEIDHHQTWANWLALEGL